MEPVTQKADSGRIHVQTILLSTIAGYCDTATFVSADSIFSAHVTGNFIVFAAQVVLGQDARAWIKLLTFPVFVTAVIVAGWIMERAQDRYRVLLIEGLILIACGVMGVLAHPHADPLFFKYGRVMLIVFAMGLQNAFGKVWAKETHGPTTMMTGNVTQASLDLGTLLRRGGGPELRPSLKKQLITVTSFLAGCLLGACISHFIGLGSVILPGTAMIICHLIISKKKAA